MPRFYLHRRPAPFVIAIMLTLAVVSVIACSSAQTATPFPTTTPAPTVTPVPTVTPAPTPASATTQTPAPGTPVALAQGTWSVKMVTSRGNPFYSNLEVNFSQDKGTLVGNGPYTYGSGGTTLITEVTSGMVDEFGNVELIFTVKEGTSLRATFRLTGKAHPSTPDITPTLNPTPTPVPVPTPTPNLTPGLTATPTPTAAPTPSTSNKISGDPLPEGNSGFEPCSGACGYEAILESGSSETGFFTMSNP